MPVTRHWQLIMTATRRSSEMRMLLEINQFCIDWITYIATLAPNKYLWNYPLTIFFWDFFSVFFRPIKAPTTTYERVIHWSIYDISVSLIFVLAQISILNMFEDPFFPSVLWLKKKVYLFADLTASIKVISQSNNKIFNLTRRTFLYFVFFLFATKIPRTKL